MLTEIIIWLIAIEILSLISFPICFRIFRSFKDRGYTASKLVGISLLAYCSWILGFAFGFSRNIILFSAFAIACISLFIISKNRKEIESFIKKTRKSIIQIEAVFIFLFLFFLLIRAQKPEIDSLEKFMDFGFLNSMVRSDAMPPNDMWMSGESINYYYFGHMIVAALTKLTAIQTAFTYNLGFAMWYALFSILVYSMALEITGKKRYGFIALLLVCISGNFFGIIQLFTFAYPQTAQPIADLTNLNYSINCCRYANAGLWLNIENFQLWPSTRIVSNAINEFPSATFLFGDLHAHYMGFAFQVLIFMLILCIMRSGIERNIAIFTGLFLGISGAVSFWIYFIIGPALMLPFIMKKDFKKATKVILIFVLSLVLLSPFYLNVTKAGSGFGFMEEHISLIHMFILFGIPLSLFLWDGFRKPEKNDIIIIILSIIIAIFSGIHSFAILIPILAWSTGFPKEKNEARKYAMILASAATIVFIFTEIFYFDGRFNTIFKLYLCIWISYGISAALVLSQAKKSSLTKAVVGILLAISMIIPLFVTLNFAGMHNTKGLDGIAYLSLSNPDDYRAIKWINENVRGSPVIIEAPGRAYTYDSRISSNTGLPGVIGWSNHEFSWRGIWPSERENDVNTIYTTNDAGIAIALLKKYNVTYIYVGSVERERYIGENLAKFSSLPELKLVYDRGARIYEVIE